MTRTDDYRRFARACLDLARTSDDSQTRALMLQMAQIWQRLARGHDGGEAGEPEKDDP